MKGASCLIALMFLSTSLFSILTTGAAADGTQMGHPASRAGAGPFGPSDLVKLFDSGPIAGDIEYPTIVDDLNGDGNLDLMYIYHGSGGSTTIVSAVNLKTHKYLWNWTAPTMAVWHKLADLNGDGKKELVWVTTTNVYVVKGTDGTVAWSKPVAGSGGYTIGDVNGDKKQEVIISYGANVQYRAYNGSTGALVWSSGLMGATYGPQVGELDNDGHQELVVQSLSLPDYGINVLDAVSNTTEWSKTYTTNIDVLVDDFNGSGKDAVLIRATGSPVNLTLYGKGGNVVWSNNNYQSPAYIYQVFNTDNDNNKEILSSDPFSDGMELIDTAKGKSQGYAYCSTYPPIWTVPIETGPTNTSDIVSMGQGSSDYGLVFYKGTNMNFINNYSFKSQPAAFKRDIDGDGQDELVVRASLDSVYSYDYSTQQLKWKNTSFGASDQLVNGWITGGFNAANKVIDTITSSMVGGGPASRIVFLNGITGNTVVSTSTYENPVLLVNDTDKDGIDELLLFTDAYGTSVSHIYLLKDDFPPAVKIKIPTIQMFEDTNLTHALDLSTVFIDDGMNGPLTYTAVPGTGTSPIVGSLSGTWLDLKVNITDWNGDTFVNVTASDGKHPATVATVNIHVIPVNDAPTIVTVPDQSFLERSHASFQVVAHDVDHDHLFFTDNSTMFNIDIDTGWVNFTPTEADVGVHFVNVTVTDPGNLLAYAHFKVTIVDINDPPVITTTDVLTAMEGSLYKVKYNAIDPDKVDTVLTWSLRTTAKFLHMDQATGNLSGTPTTNDVGHYPVNVTVTDPRGDFAFHNFTLLVLGVEHPPVWKTVPPDATINDLDNYTFTVSATDVDKGDTVTYGVRSTPSSSIAMETATGRLSWTPVLGTQGDFSINITATDGKLTIYHVYKITVIYNNIVTNNPPTSTLSTPTDKATVLTLNPSLTWTVFDADADTVTSSVYLSTDMALVQAHDHTTLIASGLSALSYKPTNALEANKTYYWTVLPSDGKATGTCTNFVWSFKTAAGATVNHPPVLQQITSRSVTAGQTFSFKVNGSDVDPGDTAHLVFGLVGAPSGMTIAPSTGMINWVTDASMIGNYTIKVTLTDGKDPVSTTFALEVKKATVTPPPKVKPHNDNGLLMAVAAGAVVAVIAVVIGILLWTRTRKKGDVTPSGPSEKPSEGTKGKETPVTKTGEQATKPEVEKAQKEKIKVENDAIDDILADLEKPSKPMEGPKK